MLGENVSRRRISEGVDEAHAAGHVGDDPPVGARLAGEPQERPLARDAAFGVGDSPVLFAPGGGGQRDVSEANRIGLRDNRPTPRRRGIPSEQPPTRRVRQRIDRIGRHDPERLDATVADGAEHIDRLQSRLFGDERRAPEALHAVTMSRGSRCPCGRRACWRARRPRVRPWRLAAR